MTSIVSFARRLNPDSSLDSICTKCYQTVASAQCEDDDDVLADQSTFAPRMDICPQTRRLPACHVLH